MDAILFAFLLSVAVFIRPQKNMSESLSIENTLSLRGIMAVAIVLHHMAEKTLEGRFFPFMIHMGYLIVAVFFFLSGYGLMFSYNKKGKEYLKGFWKKRILYLFLVFILVSVIYSVYHLIIGDFVFRITIAENSWYIPVQIVLYIIFFVSFKVLGEKNKAVAILSVFVLQTILTALLIIMRYKNYWYMSNYAFFIGILFAQNKGKIDDILKKYYWFALFGSIVMFLGFSYLPRFIGLYDYCRMVSTVFFCLIIVLIFNKIKISGKLWSFIGGFSLELYLIHGLVYLVLRRFIDNNILWTVLTVAISLPLAFLLSKADKAIKKGLKI
ncbi:MAG: acyltransferase family protein [Clostridia bacterium]|nr:acyltransferase family protein [Clostridia bacterium]